MSQPPRFLFFADSGDHIGGGHVMRSLTLAEAVAAQGGTCAFVGPPAVQAILTTFGTGAVGALAAEDADVATVAALADDWRADWIVVDHYRLALADEQALRGPGRRIAVVDDLAERPRDADLVLDPSYGRRPETYAPLTPPGCVVLTGPEFALVRPAFADMRDKALERRKAGRMRRGLVSLGMTDVDGITERVVKALLPHIGGVVLDVPLGSRTASVAPLRTLAIQDPRVRVHLDSLAMAELIANADIAVGAGGSSTWERCCLGLPSVTVILADNQRPLAQALARDGISPAVEAADLGALPGAWKALAENSAERLRLSGVSAALCDGYGAMRVAMRLTSL